MFNFGLTILRIVLIELLIIIALTRVPNNLFLNIETGNNEIVKFKIVLEKLNNEEKIVFFLLVDFANF